MFDLDAAFYRRREAAERALAAQCNDPDIAAIHRQMADDYAAKAERLERPTINPTFP